MKNTLAFCIALFSLVLLVNPVYAAPIACDDQKFGDWTGIEKFECVEDGFAATGVGAIANGGSINNVLLQINPVINCELGNIPAKFGATAFQKSESATIGYVVTGVGLRGSGVSVTSIALSGKELPANCKLGGARLTGDPEKAQKFEKVSPGYYVTGVGGSVNSGNLTGIYLEGKTIKGQNSAPEFEELPDKTIEGSSSNTTGLIDLYDFVSDFEDRVNELTYSIVSQSNPGLINCKIAGNRYVDCKAPEKNKSGMNTITIQAKDTQGQVARSSFNVNVTLAQNSPPTIRNIPDITVIENSTPKENLIDLEIFAFDNEDSDEELTFEIVSQSNSNLINCFLESDNRVSCNAPRQNQTGTNTIVVFVEDTGGATATDTFKVTVEEQDNTSQNDPAISNLPDREIEENSQAQARIIDLFEYASDNEDSDDQLRFELDNESNVGLIDCFIESYRYVSCNSPDDDRTGSSTITVRVTDSDNRTDTDSFTITVSDEGSDNGSDAPTLSGLPDEEIDGNDGQQRIFDLFSYVSDDEDSDSELDFRIVSQSDTSAVFCEIVDDRYIECDPREDDEGESTVVIEVEDTDNLTDRDSFLVRVNNDGSSGICSEIRVSTRTIFMNENEEETVTIDLLNESDEDFDIEDIEVDDDSIHLEIDDVEFDSFLESGDSTELEMVLSSNNLIANREATVTIRIEGEFEDGGDCELRDIRRSFRVVIDNDNNDEDDQDNENGICSEIRIETSNIEVDENSRKTEQITIRNDSDSTFTINTLTAVEVSNPLRLTLRNKPTSIPKNNEREVDLDIRTEGVLRTTEEDVEIRVSGRFSNGRFCSTSTINEEFKVSIVDENDNGSTQESKTVQATLLQTSLSMEVNDTRAATLTLKNDLGNNECFSVSAGSNEIFSVTPAATTVCVNDNQTSNVTFNVAAKRSGNSTLDIRINYDGKTITRAVAINIRQTEVPLSISASTAQTIAASGKITLRNSGADLTGVEINVANLPAGVEIDSVSKQFWSRNETVELDVAVSDSFDGNVSATIRVDSDQGTRSVPIQFRTGTENSDSIGFVGLVTTAGTALGMIIIIILAIIGILAIIRPK